MSRKKELTLEAGKCYKIRQGLKVELLGKRRGTWIGVIYVDGTAKPAGWNEDGSYDGFFNGSDSYLDIVAEWNEDDEWEDADPTKITLNMLPIEARFKNELDESWCYSRVCGYWANVNRYQCAATDWWDFCQVKKGVQK